MVIVAGGAKYDGIRLTNATNVVIERADLQFNNAGIRLQLSNGTIVRDSTVRASKIGISLEGTLRADIRRNQLSVNDQDVAFGSFTPPRSTVIHATLNVFRENNLSIATGQFGFFFPSVLFYDNDIDPSNVVNFLPVRWHTNVIGTPTSPVVISDEAVDVKGTTNVGQVVCYNCAYVRIQNINATSGSASGLVIEKGRNVTMVNVFAEGNDVAGILLLNSLDLTIESPSTYANRVGVQGQNVTNLTIATGRIAANQQGVSLMYANDTRLRENTIERNTDGVVLDRVNRTASERNTIQLNSGDGMRITQGVRNAARNETIVGNGGAGVMLSNTLNATVATSRIENNTRGGVVLAAGTYLSRVTSNTFSANAEGGIWLNAAGPLNRIDGNTLSAEAKHLRFTSTEQSIVDTNRMTGGVNETGLWFDDEKSYTNEIATTNTVNETPVRWYVALVGSPNAPIVLRNIRSETENVTNIAQIMIYKGSYVDVIDARASQGARGIYALRSSSVTVEDADLQRNLVGVEMSGTQTGEIRRVVVNGSRSGILLANAVNVSIEDVSAPGTRIAVEIGDAQSRGSVIQRINATGTIDMSVRDPTAATKEPRHLIADAGLDKLVGADRNASFMDAIGVARFGSERILRQAWSFGDGATEETTLEATLRPIHAYAEPGNYTATYTIETADRLALTDTVRVRVVPPPEAPSELAAVPATQSGRVALNWTPPASEFPITKYKVYRGLDAENLTFLLELAVNETTVPEAFETPMDVFYAVSAIAFGGESEMSDPFQIRLRPPPPPPTDTSPTVTPTATAEEKGSPLPALPLVLAVVGLAAWVARRRS